MTRRIRRSSIDALLERINLIDVVSQTVQLRRSGARSMGKCPFHEDSSPSFLVDEKHYHCFGCKAHGNAIDFEMNRTGTGFVDAVETLANRFNFNLDYENNSQESEQDKALLQERRNLAHVMTEVTRAYAKYLWTNDGGSALSYLRARGFTDENIKDWEIGLSPANNVLIKMAEKRGWSMSQLESAGLLKKRESADDWYDFFRDRIMIPIRDDKGNPIALGGRVFKPAPVGRAAPPKYLNSPETPLFQKSKTLFNLHRARTAIVQSGFVVVVEGYMDCLALARAGLLNVVAVLGTALTPEHLKKLARLTKRLVICFDSDNAGREAARRTFEIGFPLNLVELQYVNVPSGKDPDEFIRDKGIDAFKQLLDRALPLSQWVCDLYLAQGQSREAQVRKIKSDFVPVVMKNPDAAVREVTLESVAVVLGLSSVAALTSGLSFQPQRSFTTTVDAKSGVATPGSNVPQSQHSSDNSLSPLNESVQENSGLMPLSVTSAEEAGFLIAFAHSYFSMLPPRLQNVLQGRQSEEPMDEIVLAQLLSNGMSSDVSAACLAWSGVQLQSERELALVDSSAGVQGMRDLLPSIKAIASLDPEALLEAGLDTWVRGVLEPGQGGFVKPQLRNLENLFDPVNLPFVRMTVRDVGVSRARNGLAALLSRTLANMEIAYLDSEIDQTNRDLKMYGEAYGEGGEEREALSQRLRKLAAERVRRYQKFVQRHPG
ncbi:MAG: primase [Pseudomonadota bacterium]|jgi:DNA primase catalytic core